MFPLRTRHRIADALLELADAALRPEPEAPGGVHASAAGGSQLVAREHPHRVPLRIERMRRPGAVPARAQHCVSPVSRAPRQDERAATQR